MKILIVLMSLISVMAFAAEKGHEKTETDPAALFPKKQANKEVVTVAPTPTLQGPAFMEHVSGDSVTLKWSEEGGVTKFHVQVATDPNFKWLKTDEQLFSGTSYEVKGLEKGKHYYWRVAGMKPENDREYLKGNYAKSMFDTSEH